MWADVAEPYEAVFAKLTVYTIPFLLDAAGVADTAVADAGVSDTAPAGTRVLDVGTGPGPVARAAVARGAAVTAVDAEPSMVALARRNVPEADVELAVLPELPAQWVAARPFDAVVGNFVLNHFGQPRTALAALRGVARPGALIAMTFWPTATTSGRSLKKRSFEAVGLVGATDLPTVDADEDYARDEAGLAALFRECGLTDVETSVIEWDHRATADEWWLPTEHGMAGAGQGYVAQSPEKKAEIKARYAELATEMTDADGVLILPHLAILAVGRN